jgi:hypothetical protein
VSSDAVRQAIETRFQTNWTTTTIKWDGVPFQEPEPKAPWVAFVVLMGDGNQASLGDAPLKRVVGVVSLQIFLPENSGVQVAYSLADTFAGIFDRKQFGTPTVTTRICSAPRRIGPRNGWEQFVTDVSFYWNEVVS